MWFPLLRQDCCVDWYLTLCPLSAPHSFTAELIVSQLVLSPQWCRGLPWTHNFPLLLLEVQEISIGTIPFSQGIMDGFSAFYASYFPYQLVAHCYWHSSGVSTGTESVYHLFYSSWWWDGCTISMSMNCGPLLMHWSVQQLLGGLNRLESWADRSHIKSIKSKCRILYIRCRILYISNKQQVTGKLL